MNLQRAGPAHQRRSRDQSFISAGSVERRLSTGAKKPRTTSDRTRSFGWRAKNRANENPGVGSAQEERARFERSGTMGGVTIAARETTTLSAPYPDSPTVPQISVGSPPGAPRARNVQHTFNSLIYNSRRKKKEGGEREGGKKGEGRGGGGERKKKGGKREGGEEGEEVERSARQRRRSEKIGEKNKGRVVEEEEERRGRGRRRMVTEMVRLRRRRSRWKEVKTEGMPTPPLAPRWKRFDNAVRRSSTLYMERRPRGWSPAGRLARRHPGFIGTIGRVENHRSLT